jgi:hypothetical protein
MQHDSRRAVTGNAAAGVAGGGILARPGAGSGPDKQNGAGGVIDDEPRLLGLRRARSPSRANLAGGPTTRELAEQP